MALKVTWLHNADLQKLEKMKKERQAKNLDFIRLKDKIEKAERLLAKFQKEIDRKQASATMEQQASIQGSMGDFKSATFNSRSPMKSLTSIGGFSKTIGSPNGALPAIDEEDRPFA